LGKGIQKPCLSFLRPKYNFYSVFFENFFVAYLVGGLVLVGQSLKNYVLGFITGIPLLIILSKKARSKAISIFKRK